jgi:5-methylcytosine-specific restriction protein B
MITHASASVANTQPCSTSISEKPPTPARRNPTTGRVSLATLASTPGARSARIGPVKVGLANVTDPDAVLAAIREADELGRAQFLKKYGFAESREYFLRYDGNLYDSKAIMGAAHGFQHPDLGPLTSHDFSGGERTVQKQLEKLGFVVTTPSEGGQIGMQVGLERAMAEYPLARQSSSFSGSHPISSLFQSLAQSLRASEVVKEHPSITVTASTGQGNWAAIPWMALIGEGSTIQSGIYCVYLFREDGSGVYLTLAQGVTEPRNRLGRLRARDELRDKSAKLRPTLQQLQSSGFRLDDDIQLGDGALGTDYEASTIAHKLYERGTVQDDATLMRDLEVLLASYSQVMSNSARRDTHRVPPAKLCQDFSAVLMSAGLTFGKRHAVLVATFLASLLTKPLVLLTGLTGSGKTQIGLKFGEWLGAERRLVIPVRPDWTGPEALFGYEDALVPASGDGRKAWFVPPPLEFMLRAAQHPEEPHLLLLDEMNLAHVERYFADFLSGMESGEPTLPNLVKEQQAWRLDPEGPAALPIPSNLFVVGTVNVDETTYAFSPKVLDRAQTIEFRVATDELASVPTYPMPAPSASPDHLAEILAISRNKNWHIEHPSDGLEQVGIHLRDLHAVLSKSDLEFGYRTNLEGIRFASIYSALGRSDWHEALDLITLQKILPRIHGPRARVEEPLKALERFCFLLSDDESKPLDGEPTLAMSLLKVRRMLRLVRANQFVSFTE